MSILAIVLAFLYIVAGANCLFVVMGTNPKKELQISSYVLNIVVMVLVVILQFVTGAY